MTVSPLLEISLSHLLRSAHPGVSFLRGHRQMSGTMERIIYPYGAGCLVSGKAEPKAHSNAMQLRRQRSSWPNRQARWVNSLPEIALKPVAWVDAAVAEIGCRFGAGRTGTASLHDRLCKPSIPCMISYVATFVHGYMAWPCSPPSNVGIAKVVHKISQRVIRTLCQLGPASELT